MMLHCLNANRRCDMSFPSALRLKSSGCIGTTLASDRKFKSDKDIGDHCCETRNQLKDQPCRIISTGSRDWVYGH